MAQPGILIISIVFSKSQPTSICMGAPFGILLLMKTLDICWWKGTTALLRSIFHLAIAEALQDNVSYWHKTRRLCCGHITQKPTSNKDDVKIYKSRCVRILDFLKPKQRTTKHDRHSQNKSTSNSPITNPFKFRKLLLPHTNREVLYVSSGDFITCLTLLFLERKMRSFERQFRPKAVAPAV